MEDTQTEQGQVSSPGESPKDVNQNTFTDEETSLAAKYHVEPKLIRTIVEIVADSTDDICSLVSLIKGEMEQQIEAQEQPAELTIDQQTQERIKDYFKNLDPRTKLAIVTLSEIQTLDGINFQFRNKEGRLYDAIWDDMQSVCIETFHRKPGEDIPFGITDTEDVWLAGVWEAVRMVIQNC